MIAWALAVVYGVSYVLAWAACELALVVCTLAWGVSAAWKSNTKGE